MPSHSYYMGIARSVAEASKDPSTKVGCVLISPEGRLISSGYNGFVRGGRDDLMSFTRPLKYFLILHSEANAIMFAKEPLNNCIAYITHAPCSRCLAMLLQNGIKEVYYESASLCVRFEEVEKEAIRLLLAANNASILNLANGKNYLEEL